MAAKPLPAQDVLHQLLSYDPNTGKLFWKERGPEWFAGLRWPDVRCAATWNGRYAGSEALGAVHSTGYRHGRLLRREVQAHRVIWAMHYGELPEIIDHIDGDKQNNRLSNLRAVTNSENLRNSRRSSRNTSGATGVSKMPNGRWQATIWDGLRNNSLGAYESFERALAARKAAEREYGFHENHGRAA